MNERPTQQTSMSEQARQNNRRNVRQKIDERYQPTQAELEADVSIEATPEELAAAVVGRDPRRSQ